MELPQPSGRPAWLFDFDGTLAEIAPTPDAARVPRGLIDTIARLLGLEVAIAIVSGRPLAEIDALLAPLRLPAAGVHGAERRDAGGRVQRIAVPDLRPALDLLHSFGERHDGVRVEVKPGAVALHYRLAPQLERDCIDIMERAAAEVPAMAVLRGKMVVELKPQAVDKGRAVRAFLAEPPFRGRQAWYFGDDVTDEAAFAAVQYQGGIAVKLGEGPSVAAYRLPGPEQMLRWLERAAEDFEHQRRSPQAAGRALRGGR